MWLKTCESKGPPRKPPGNGRSKMMGWKKTSFSGGIGVSIVEGIFCKVTCNKIWTWLWSIRFAHFFRDFLQHFLSYLDSREWGKTSNFATLTCTGHWSRQNGRHFGLTPKIPKTSESLRGCFFLILIFRNPPKKLDGLVCFPCVFHLKKPERKISTVLEVLKTHETSRGPLQCYTIFYGILNNHCLL